MKGLRLRAIFSCVRDRKRTIPYTDTLLAPSGLWHTLAVLFCLMGRKFGEADKFTAHLCQTQAAFLDARGPKTASEGARSASEYGIFPMRVGTLICLEGKSIIIFLQKGNRKKLSQ